MRTLAVALTFAVAMVAAEPEGLRFEDPAFRQFDDGPPFQQAYRPGEQVFFDLRVVGYGRSEGENPALKLTWTFRGVDADSRSLEPPVSGQLESALAAQDTDYRPRVRFGLTVPTFALDGQYRILLKLTDEVASKSVEGSFVFRVRGKQLPKVAPLEAANWRFLRQEDDINALALPVYRAGSEVWLRFELQGYRLSENNGFSVSYGVTVTGPDGKQFLKQHPAATESQQPFYPQRYVPATFVIQLPPKAFAGEYRVAIVARDLESETEQTVTRVFRVE